MKSDENRLRRNSIIHSSSHFGQTHGWGLLKVGSESGLSWKQRLKPERGLQFMGEPRVRNNTNMRGGIVLLGKLPKAGYLLAEIHFQAHGEVFRRFYV